MKYEKKYTGCAQSTIGGIFDVLGIRNDDVFKAASGLADGLGLTGDGTCGALMGGAMAISYIFGRERKDFPDMRRPMKSYLMCKKLHDQFLEMYSSCRCHDIQKTLTGRTFNLLDKEQFDEAVSIGIFDQCSKVAGNAAKLACLIIEEEKEKGDARQRKR
jgi:C_GCAxxG_C_C family probable redox protein